MFTFAHHKLHDVLDGVEARRKREAEEERLRIEKEKEEARVNVEAQRGFAGKVIPFVCRRLRLLTSSIASRFMTFSTEASTGKSSRRLNSSELTKRPKRNSRNTRRFPTRFVCLHYHNLHFLRSDRVSFRTSSSVTLSRIARTLWQRRFTRSLVAIVPTQRRTTKLNVCGTMHPPTSKQSRKSTNGFENTKERHRQAGRRVTKAGANR